MGQELFGLGDQAGHGARAQADGGVAEPVGRAQPGELVNRVSEDLEVVGGGGQLPGVGRAQRGAGSCGWASLAGRWHPAGPEMREVFVPGNEIMVVFTRNECGISGSRFPSS